MKIKKNAKGVCLREATGKERNMPLLQLLLSVLLSTSLLTVLCFCCGLGKSSLLVSAAVCAIYAVLQYFGKEKYFALSALFIVFAITVLLRRYMTEGLALAWDNLGYTYTAASGKVMPLLQSGTASQNASMALFAALCGAILAMGSIFLVSKARIFAAALPIVVLFLVNGMLKVENITCTALCITTSIALLLGSAWQQDKEGLFALLCGGIMIGLSASLLLAMFQLPGIKTVIDDADGSLKEKLDCFRYKTEYSFLPEGDFTNYKNKQAEGYTALTVTMESPEAMFLRGFVGDSFDGNVWTQTDNKLLAENRELLYWTQKESFYSQNQFAKAAELSEVESGRISIENHNASSKFVYLPYSFTESEAGLLRDNVLSTSALKTEGFFGQRSYSYSAVKDAVASTAAVLKYLQQERSSEAERYLHAETAYREYIMNSSLQVPEDFVKRMGPLLDTFSQSYGEHNELSLEQAQSVALAFLEYCFAEENNGVELPLQQASGTQFQYSTVAALALRYYGIPARYAEGYEITQHMINEAKNSNSIAVDSKMGRAWVEIYQQGIGWMPMEQTPGMEALVGQMGESGIKPVGMEGIDSNSETGSVEGEGEGIPIAEGQEQDRDSADKDDSDGFLQSGGSLVLLRKIIRWTFLLILLAVALLPLLIILRRHIIIKRKRRCFTQADCREAVGWIYADAAEMLSRMGLDRNGGSMESVCEKAHLISEDFGNMCDAMTELNGRALFSSKSVSEQERRAMLLFRSETLCWLKENISWYRKLWLRWGLCLY
ncbi:MAG: hypothetical protein IJ364_06485 [Oscillospiraceae bacterium]|nr:hypothetical protein [Oscillospiraceae bacterium]